VAGNQFGVALDVRTFGEARSAGAFRMNPGVDNRVDTGVDRGSTGRVGSRGRLHHGYQRYHQKDQHRNQHRSRSLPGIACAYRPVHLLSPFARANVTPTTIAPPETEEIGQTAHWQCPIPIPNHMGIIAHAQADAFAARRLAAPCQHTRASALAYQHAG
jgi:hypothetical protein